MPRQKQQCTVSLNYQIIFHGAQSASNLLSAYSETLAAEVAGFGICVLLVAPGFFRTENTQKTMQFINNRIAAYDSVRDGTREMLQKAWHLVKGDPVKAMEVLVDVVRGEGKAGGRDFPFWLLLGNVTYGHVKAHSERLLQTMDAWEDVAKDLDYDE